MTIRILLVDDDVDLVELLRDYLEREGFEVDVVHNGEAGTEAALSGRYHIVVLDVMMPGKSGIEALVHIRGTSSVPVLMLTARGDDIDRIVGLELGADDYVPKPCMPRELAARIRAILKRVGGGTLETGQTITVNALTIWSTQRRAEWAGIPLDLTSTEFNILEVLAHHAGCPVDREELSQKALGRPLTRFDRTIDVHVSSLRHKLGRLADGRSCIQTVIRKGYQLVRE
ncbi:DNA-binding transcriptional dual regulator CpxR [Gammaproteobacteria bacterium]